MTNCSDDEPMSLPVSVSEDDKVKTDVVNWKSQQATNPFDNQLQITDPNILTSMRILKNTFLHPINWNIK